MSRRVAIGTLGVVALVAAWATTRSGAQAEEEALPPTAIEELTFLVDVAGVDRFLELDNAIWTAHLAEQPGFLGKEAWRLDTDPAGDKATVKLVIRWRSRADWNAVPLAGLEATETRFAKAMADVGSYELVKVHAYELARTGSGSTGVPISTLDVKNLLTDAKWLARAAEIEVANTPDFGPDRRYRAIRLADVLRDNFALEGEDPDKTTLIFRCVDGYEPMMSLAEAQAAEGWLAFQDLDLAPNQEWTVTQAGGKRVSVAPGYLVWRDAPRGSKLPWPYALAEIRVMKSDPLDAVAAPKDLESHGAGFAAFKQHCAKCHRLYGVGGQMGPELASPRNITTYWNRDDLKAFIRNPLVYRRGSPMPPMPHLSQPTIESIVAYLEALPATN
ncbi:MAG: TIGR03792 family protein [Planctomycetota bacterium]